MCDHLTSSSDKIWYTPKNQQPKISGSKDTTQDDVFATTNTIRAKNLQSSLHTQFVSQNEL
jgi:hypothetical protein